MCIVTTQASSIDNWIKPTILPLQKAGFEITIVSNMSFEYIEKIQKEFCQIKLVSIPFPRGISFLKSIKATFFLYKLFRTQKYDIVQYSTPNASFYSAIASYYAKIKVRLYCQWGMVYVGFRGIKRNIFKLLEKLTCFFSTDVQPDSFGNIEFCRKEKLYGKEKSRVIWNGSAKGVDLKKFDFSKKQIYKEEIFKRYSIDKESFIIGFVGRLGKDKGCNELFQSFKILEEKYTYLKLIFIGPIEKEETIKADLLKWFYNNKSIIITGRIFDVEKYMAAMDVFVLPSYREGFGMSVVEAEAMGVPVVVTNIPGPTDGMLPDETGLVVPVGDTLELIRAIEKIINDFKLREEFSKRALEFSRKNFNSEEFIEKMVTNRLWLLKR